MKMIQRVLLLGLTVSLLAGCSALTTDEPSATSSIPPLKMDSGRSSCGNEPSYTLKGKTYQVLGSVSGYREEGKASWYGAELQGSKTAGCETFDMNSFSAAHRSLPLPSFVRVTNLENQKAVIVRVNDRGPFDTDDLIQLSFAAANALGMGTKGGETAQVRIEALDNQQTAALEAGQSKLAEHARVKAQQTPEQIKAEQAAKATGKSFYVVVNNFAEQDEALEMFVRLTSVGLAKTEMATAMQEGKQMHQVRIGPLYTQDQIDTVKDALESNGLATFRVVEINQ
ncbi:septal ring lytic transglycosylase RlpA family protein [uncultured Thiothrix sp.]|uniref:septal ring lytic transglycosylase RlpA family protein n=1 Tax=uncultured Thiothrix sp. TaxID=223185 RepID=UPI0026235780|nr:septal ring lytic transglycosylase RlpA family protein [uncultured Thiothrix sp.]